MGMGFPDRQHLFHHVAVRQTVLIEGNNPGTVSIVRQGPADPLVEDSGHAFPDTQRPLQILHGFPRRAVIHDEHPGDLRGDPLQTLRETRIGEERDHDGTDPIGGYDRRWGC